jgi:urea transport system permease protein
VSLTLDILFGVGSLTLVVTGLFLIFGLLHVINLAHAGLMAVGVYAQVSFRSHGIPFWVAVLLSALVAGAVGALIEVVVIRRLYARPLDTILATWGVSLVVIQVITLIYGPGNKFLDLPTTSATTIFGTPYATYRLLLILFAAAIVAGLGLVVHFTGLGLTIRAVMSNEPLARAHGINTIRARQLTFIVGAAFAGAAGALLGPIQGIDPNFGATAVATAFLAVLLAGRTLPGLVLSCVMLGATQILFSRYVNSIWASAFVIGLAVVLLRIRPEGLAFRRAST